VVGTGPRTLGAAILRPVGAHVTLGVRLVSVLDDDIRHVGQAAYVRGTVLRRG
jgi:hypothetical protein